MSEVDKSYFVDIKTNIPPPLSQQQQQPPVPVDPYSQPFMAPTTPTHGPSSFIPPLSPKTSMPSTPRHYSPAKQPFQPQQQQQQNDIEQNLMNMNIKNNNKNNEEFYAKIEQSISVQAKENENHKNNYVSILIV